LNLLFRCTRKRYFRYRPLLGFVVRKFKTCWYFRFY